MGNELDVVKQRVENGIVALKAEVTHVVATLEPELQADIKAAIEPLIHKLWDDVLAAVQVALAPSNSQETNVQPQNEKRDL